MRKYTDDELWSLFLSSQAEGIVEAVATELENSPELLSRFQSAGIPILVAFAQRELAKVGKDQLVLASNTGIPEIKGNVFLNFFVDNAVPPVLFSEDLPNDKRWSTELELGKAYAYRPKGGYHFLQGSSREEAFEDYDEEDTERVLVPGVFLRRRTVEFHKDKIQKKITQYIHLAFLEERDGYVAKGWPVADTPEEKQARLALIASVNRPEDLNRTRLDDAIERMGSNASIKAMRSYLSTLQMQGKIGMALSVHLLKHLEDE